MPRDLGDVLHYFLPEAGPPPRVERPAALPILSLPIGDGDVVRAALAWNLAVEIARQGASATLLSPAAPSPVWPEPGRGPIGTEVVRAAAEEPGALARAALDVAVTRAAETDLGVVLAPVPPAWLGSPQGERTLQRWVLLLSSPDRRDLLEAYRVAKRLWAAGGDPRIGLTIHGVRRIGQAESAFRHVADVAARRLGRTLVSYGLMVDDLHVYRAIAARRPIGLEHPQSRAARALRDVARLVLEDARKTAGA